MRWSDAPRDLKWMIICFGISFFACFGLCVHFATQTDPTFGDLFFSVASGFFALCFAVFLLAAVRALCLPRKSIEPPPREPVVEEQDALTPVLFFMNPQSRAHTDKVRRYFEEQSYVGAVNRGMSWTLACINHVEEGGEVLFRYADGRVEIVAEFAKSDPMLSREEEEP